MAKHPRIVSGKDFEPFPPSIRCAECVGLNAKRDERFSPPRKFRDPATEFADIMITPIKPFFLLLEIWQNFLCGR